LKQRPESAGDRIGAAAPPASFDLGLLLSLAFLATLWYVAMEWLFFATAASFLTSLAARERLLMPAAAALLVGAAVAAATALAALPGRLAGSRRPGDADRLAPGWRRLALAPTAAVLALSALLMLDNFVHTLFGSGLTTLSGPWRWLRPVLAALLLLGLLERLLGWTAAVQRRQRMRRAFGATALLAAAIGAGSLASFPRAAPPVPVPPRRPGAPSPPLNVLLLGGDGIEAGNTSLYGYAQPTTPFLAGLAPQALVCERAYVNAQVTGASLVSILTGMLPTETGVIYPPDVARGAAVRGHLPGILRAHGYVGEQLTIRYYGDAGDLNLVDSFAVANGRRLEAAWSGLGLQRFAPSLRLFLTILGERVEDRALPGVRVGAMAFAEVRGEGGSFQPDDERMRALAAFVREAREPFFAHLHLMATHGPRYFARRRVQHDAGSAAAVRKKETYDDAILDFDGHVEEVFALLRRQGLLDRTLVVVYSDHGRGHAVDRPVPLLLRFPHGAHAGRIRGVTQLIDVAPTVLDALGIPAPPTMRGWSLLRGEPPCRPVIVATANLELVDNVGARFYVVPRPPFFSLGTLTLLDGHRSYALDLPHDRLDVSALPAATWCPGLGPEPARARLLATLVEGGYDVSSLRPASTASREARSTPSPVR
jgi:arylsulfatase